SFIHRMNKLSHKTDSYMQGFKEHCKNPTIVLLHKVVNHGTKNFRNYKRKLSFGAKVLQAGGIDKVFREYFAVEKDEKLRKAFQCYLSTTAGPIAGMLFISTKKIAFHSDRPLSFTSPKGGSTRVPYKVLIPTERMKSASVRILYFLSVSFFVGTERCCRPDDLRRPFGKFGPVKDIYLPKDYYTREPRGFGFIQYFDPEDASDELGSGMLEIQGARGTTRILSGQNCFLGQSWLDSSSEGLDSAKTVYKAFDKLEGVEVAWSQSRINDSVMESHSNLQRHAQPFHGLSVTSMRRESMIDKKTCKNQRGKFEEDQATIKDMDGAELYKQIMSVDWAFSSGPAKRRHTRK
ncbi:hypothetical protein ACJX0J_007243, partial [Zea mays]